MPYDFNYDLSGIPRSFFRELVRVAEQRQLHKRLGMRARTLAKTFKLSEATGLDVQNLLTIIEDLVDVQILNARQRDTFAKTERRALFLPHCSRKHMDGSCKAQFDATVPSYSCAHCSSDCLVSKATTLGEEKGYAVFVVPGGSCIPGIIKKSSFEGIVGVACGQELIPAYEMTKRVGLPTQAVPLIKNGCANTVFSYQVLEGTL
ncbi:MAG: DUF116 domain-containing protein [Candidatus Bathyarchaeia archaeon]|jgi:hypothetical protein